MDKAKKNEVIRAAAGRMAEIYKEAEIPLYGDAQRMPSRDTVIEIIRDCQKLLFGFYELSRSVGSGSPKTVKSMTAGRTSTGQYVGHGLLQSGHDRRR